MRSASLATGDGVDSAVDGFVGNDKPFLIGAAGSDGSAGSSFANAAINRAPHFSQNTLAGGLGVPHRGQRALVTDGSFAAHSLQKREPSRLAVPQFGQ